MVFCLKKCFLFNTIFANGRKFDHLFLRSPLVRFSQNSISESYWRPKNHSPKRKLKKNCIDFEYLRKLWRHGTVSNTSFTSFHCYIDLMKIVKEQRRKAFTRPSVLWQRFPTTELGTTISWQCAEIKFKRYKCLPTHQTSWPLRTSKKKIKKNVADVNRTWIAQIQIYKVCACLVSCVRMHEENRQNENRKIIRNGYKNAGAFVNL